MKTQNEEAESWKSTLHSAKKGGRPEPPEKKRRSKEVSEILSGKRILNMTAARALCPPGSYLYETTDGRRCRIFYGNNRQSTSSMMSIGAALALLHCVRWAWVVYENDGGKKCPYDFAKIKFTSGLCFVFARFTWTLVCLCLVQSYWFETFEFVNIGSGILLCEDYLIHKTQLL